MESDDVSQSHQGALTALQTRVAELQYKLDHARKVSGYYESTIKVNGK